MKITVNENTCIGCGACQAICPDVFEVDGVAQVIAEEIEEENKEEVQDAIDGCPVAAISEVEE